MNVALFAEVDPNLVEGPAIWLTEVTRLLASLDSRVTVLLREPRARDEVLGVLDPLPGIEIVGPEVGGRRRGPLLRPRLSPRQAVRAAGAARRD